MRSRNSNKKGTNVDRALYAAATGMAAQQKNLDTIAANLANADVTGFKRSSMRFTALAAGDGGAIGVASLGKRLVFGQGKLLKTGGPFDCAISGPGFFIVCDDRGRHAYTRDGSFERAADGSLRDRRGWRLEGIRIPADAVKVRVARDGRVSAQTTHGTRELGRIRLAVFPAPERLHPIAGTLLAASPASGAARTIDATAIGKPQIRFGMLEASNVSVVEEMMAILGAQRAYEANAKGVQAADEMLRIADNLNRG